MGLIDVAGLISPDLTPESPWSNILELGTLIEIGPATLAGADRVGTDRCNQRCRRCTERRSALSGQRPTQERVEAATAAIDSD